MASETERCREKEVYMERDRITEKQTQSYRKKDGIRVIEIDRKTKTERGQREAETIIWAVLRGSPRSSGASLTMSPAVVQCWGLPLLGGAHAEMFASALSMISKT
jgi:hypothetical protein